ncbi:MAG TPA: oxidoreductase [Verrucomicrobiales bacterium]|nr:oxidoreductase [Verrucomicrobiales bacterium]
MPDQIYRALVLSVVKHDYLPNAVAAHPRFQLVAVADDPDRPGWTHERNQLFADQHNIPYRRDVETALADCDLVVVSPEAERHCDLALRAAEAGKHIVVDKPLSPSLTECNDLVAAVAQHGVKCLVWNRNFLPALIEARDNLTKGAIGELQAIHCDFYFSKDAGPPKGSLAPDAPPINWMERQLEAHADGSDGGVGTRPLGELQIEGIYPLAYISMLVDSPVKRVFAQTSSHFHQANVDNKVDDLATVSLEMANGCVGSLSLGRIGAAAHPDIGEIKLHLLGSEASLVISEARPEVAVYARNQAPTEFKHQRIADENNYLLMQNFVEALDLDCEPILNAAGARDIAATVQAALESAHSGKPIEII